MGRPIESDQYGMGIDPTIDMGRSNMVAENAWAVKKVGFDDKKGFSVKPNLTRRDALKLIGVTSAALLAACAPEVIYNAPRVFNGEFGPANPLVVEGFDAISNELKEAGVNLNVDPKIPFSITSGMAEFQMISVPEIVDSMTRKPLLEEKLFAYDQEKNSWFGLKKTRFQGEINNALIGDQEVNLPIISWRQSDNEGDYVLSYLEYTQEQWDLLSDFQKKEVGVTFKPLIGNEGFVPGFERENLDYIYAKGIPEAPRKGLMSLAPIEIVIPTTKPSESEEIPEATEEVTPEPEKKAVTQQEIIAGAENRYVSLEYLTSPEYKAELEQKRRDGKLPVYPTNPFYVDPTSVSIPYDQYLHDPNEASDFLKKYGAESAFTFSDSNKWALESRRPWVVVDAGSTEVSELELGFYVVGFKNPDQSEVFWGFLFIPTEQGKTLEQEINEWSGIELNGYPSPRYFSRPNGCKTFIKSYTSLDASAYCNILQANPDSALPIDAMRKLKIDGNLKLDFIPWSQGGAKGIN